MPALTLRTCTALMGVALSGGAVLATATPAVAAPPVGPPGFTQPTVGTSWRAATTVRIAWSGPIGPSSGPIELLSGPSNALDRAGILANADLSKAGSIDVTLPNDIRPSDSYVLKGGTHLSRRFTILKPAI